MDPEEIPTDALAVLESAHGLQRRIERSITIGDLKAARKHGEKELAGYDDHGLERWKFTFAGLVYLTDWTLTREITSWPVQCWGLDVQEARISVSMENEHKNALKAVKNVRAWTSNIVVVVDQSGSMRKADASNLATRADVVWLTLALQFVGKQLKTGQRTSTDVFSLIAMREDAEIIIEYHPFNWVLYNKLVDLLRNSEPRGPGNYLPALQEAKRLLLANKFKRCALNLIFLSDGRPSDKLPRGQEHGSYIHNLKLHVAEQVADLTRYCGHRLTVGVIAVGHPGSENFDVLRAISETAKAYHCRVLFQSASLSAHALTETMERVSDMHSSTKSELSIIAGDSDVHEFRDVEFEPLSDLGDDEWTEEKWDLHVFNPHGEFKALRPVTRCRWTKDGWITFPVEETYFSSAAIGVAVKKFVFGRGTERDVAEFREVDKDGCFVGHSMVAKRCNDNRKMDAKEKKSFHTVFGKTQKRAQDFAEMFNQKLRLLPGYIEGEAPSIQFLECYVYMIDHPEEGRQGYLVEKMLDIQKFPYKKWNDNAGMVSDGTRRRRTSDGQYRTDAERVKKPWLPVFSKLEIIEEEEDDEDDKECIIDGGGRIALPRMPVVSGESDRTSCPTGTLNDFGRNPREPTRSFFPTTPFVSEFDSFHADARFPATYSSEDASFSAEDIPQVFSCFTYFQTKRKMLVCDLQGILNTDTNIFELTDPVIHYRSSKNRRNVYGRTDNGEEGIHNFFKTHKCSRLCEQLRRRQVTGGNDSIDMKAM